MIRLLLWSLASMVVHGLWNTSAHISANRSVDCHYTDWIHVPKTSSTFCLNLEHVCCTKQFETLVEGITTNDLHKVFVIDRKKAIAKPFQYDTQHCYHFQRTGYPDLRCPYPGAVGNDHKPLKGDPVKRLPHTSFTIIREPKSRLVSAYLDAVHLEGQPFRKQAQFRDYLLNNITKIRTDANWLKGMKIYAAHPDIMGCQTKMLLGVQCAAPYVITPETFQEAVSRLSNFFFVGIFEEYRRSLRLFHALANKGTKPTPVEDFAMRTSDPRLKHYLMKHVDVRDHWDTQLYHQAKIIFQDQIKYVKRWKKIDV